MSALVNGWEAFHETAQSAARNSHALNIVEHFTGIVRGKSAPPARFSSPAHGAAAYGAGFFVAVALPRQTAQQLGYISTIEIKARLGGCVALSGFDPGRAFSCKLLQREGSRVSGGQENDASED
jgi:hypothetical protein